MSKHSLETKLAAVNAYLDGSESLRDIAQKFNVSKTTFHRWIARYQEHGVAGFQQTCTNYSVGFKMDVINYINKMGASIEEATVKFNVSSSGIVRSWKNTFETQGIDALQPKKKERPSMKKENKKETKKQASAEESVEALQAEVEHLRMENAYLKKLNTLVQNKEKSPNKTKHK